MRTLTFVCFIQLWVIVLNAQTTVFGTVSDSNGEPLVGANVFVKGTYDGTSANETGAYKFSTSSSGIQVIVATFIGYKPQEKEVILDGSNIEVIFKLKDGSTQISGVVITAGTYETSDRSRSVTLQPLDIVTTPSAAGDIYGALTTLPGTANVGEDGRLFVRGGDGYETKTFIDGLLSKKPYGSNVPDLPSRGRFSPFLFSGTTFSTGGYSAEYGQALSSALILTTNSFPQQTQTELSIMSVGGGVTQTFKGENSAYSIALEYMNLQPYYQLIPGKFTMNKYPESVGATLVTRHRIAKSGVLKVFSTYSDSRFGLRYPNLNQFGAMSNISIANQNSYSNISFSDNLGSWIFKSGVAFTYDNNNLDLETFQVDEQNQNLQAKIALKRSIGSKISILIGAEETFNKFNQDYVELNSLFSHNSQLNDLGSALFVETELKPLERFALRVGVRGEHSSLLNDQNLAARFSAAYLISSTSQVSFAYGNFYQTPEEQLLRFTNMLTFEQADHYIFNYQWEKNNRILRVEGYLKDYKNLVTYDGNQFWNSNLYSNSGLGYSRGIDLFYRDRKTFKMLEYWISYSYVDSKRKYRDFPEMVTPHFAPEHTASVVAKQWVQSITTQFGLSATFASGRPYNNPNSNKFMDGRTSFYNDVSINCSHLRTILSKPSIIYLSVNNLLGRDNVFGYRYYNQPNANGIYEALPIKSEAKRFYFVGVFITI